MAEQCDEEGSEPRGIDITAHGRHQPRVRQCFGQPSSSGPKEGSNPLRVERSYPRGKSSRTCIDSQQDYPK